MRKEKIESQYEPYCAKCLYKKLRIYDEVY